MQLNLPDLAALSACRNLLVAGMGGGFDVFCGLPVYWFFDLPAVADRNLFLSQVRWTETYAEARQLMLTLRLEMRVRPLARIPLP
jgi:hypothetical protein